MDLANLMPYRRPLNSAKRALQGLNFLSFNLEHMKYNQYIVYNIRQHGYYKDFLYNQLIIHCHIIKKNCLL